MTRWTDKSPAEIAALSAKNRQFHRPDFPCAYCKDTFLSSRKLARHMASEHPMVAARTADPRKPLGLDLPKTPIPAQPAAASKRATVPKRGKAGRSKGEETLRLQLIDEGMTDWEPEYRFAAPRKWRADFAFLDARLLVEVEGGHWSNGRHNRGSGFESDIEKYNAATLANWALLRFTTKQVSDGTAIKTIKRYLDGDTAG